MKRRLSIVMSGLLSLAMVASAMPAMSAPAASLPAAVKRDVTADPNVIRVQDRDMWRHRRGELRRSEPRRHWRGEGRRHWGGEGRRHWREGRNWREGRHWRDRRHWREGRRHWHRRHWHRRHWGGPRYYDPYYRSGIYLGFGGLSYGYYDPYYDAPRRVYRGLPPAHLRWCEARYRSYRPWDNTFVTYRGQRRECVSPYL